MDNLLPTDERLRTWLNGNQPSRERLCMAVLHLDRNYSDIRPRRPEGGPDGGRDIQCHRGPDLCFGAVGFLNSASDTAPHKRQIKKKFATDLTAALEQNPKPKAFVFFTNVDLTPTDVQALEQSAKAEGISHIDIYYRERIAMALNNPEGLAARYQYLSITLSEAEQQAFFSRFGRELETLLSGGFDRLEHKIDLTEFRRWQTGRVSSIELQVILKEPEASERSEREHFRVCLELQSVTHEQRSIAIGGQDDYWKSPRDTWYFATKVFFFRQKVDEIGNTWLPCGPRSGGGYIDQLNFGIRWRPVSSILAAEFDDLYLHFHFTENLLDRIARVRFSIDSYLFIDSGLRRGRIDYAEPGVGWPSSLSERRPWFPLHWSSLAL